MIQAGRAVDQPITDPVTGAYSRALLQPRLDEELERASQTEGSCALFLFDVDFFKTVNDAFGHLRGDEVLRQLADRIKGLIRGYDALFRYGGDEFVLLLPGTDRAAAIRLALRLTEEVRAHEFGADPPLHMSVSLGVATYPEDGTTGAELMACADRRNYLAKRRGRGGAVADDADTGGDTGSSRLWERDAALAATQEFLTRLEVERHGALRVNGEPGAGHTRFLAEVSSVASMRGYTVFEVHAAPAPLPTLPPAATGSRVLLVADLEATPRAAEAIAHLRASGPASGAGPAAEPPAVLGLAYATSTGPPPDPPLDLLSTAELLPWSPATLRIWLRNALQGEPSRSLVSWMSRDSGGLPARAVRELTRLRGIGGVVPAGGGGWTLAPSVLGKATRRTRLPTPMTPLMGRAPERARVRQLLAGGRLVTLVGPGGIGKTRLCLAVASSAAESYDDGAVFVPLADATNADLVVSAIASALQVAEVPGQPLLESVIEQLAESSLLLVLDNFEQVIGAAVVVSELLAAAPGVSALVTSRERLSLYGEQVYQVPPLPLPDLATLPAGPDGVMQALSDSPALALFDQRARAANSDFELSPDSLPAVARLCHRLDGLPLAIELAAARTDRWTPDALLAHLAQHLDSLGASLQDLPERQQTLRGAIDWSYVLLDPDDRQLFTAMSVFAGGCTVDAAYAVAGVGIAGAGVARGELARRLARLADRSLLAVDTEPGHDVRYRMLETIRAYAAARLADDGADPVHNRHRAYYVELAALAGSGMTGPDQAAWVDRLERDYQNLRTAIGWALGHDDVASAAQVGIGLWRYWRNGGHISEGRDWLAQMLAAPATLPGPERARVLHAAAVLATTQDDHDEGYRLGRECLTLAVEAGDKQLCAQAHNVMGIAAINRGDYHRADDHFRQTLAIWQELDHSPGKAIALGNLTKLSLRLGDVGAADEFAAECLALERSAGNTRGISLALECVGQIRLAQGDVPGARAALEESLRLNRSLGDAFGEAMAQHQLGLAAYADGDRKVALELLTTALARRFEVGDREDLAVSLECVANVVVDREPAFAVTLLGAADALRERRRLAVPPEADTHREATIAAARAALEAPEYASALAIGRTAPLELIVDETHDLVAAPASA